MCMQCRSWTSDFERTLGSSTYCGCSPGDEASTVGYVTTGEAPARLWRSRRAESMASEAYSDSFTRSPVKRRARRLTDEQRSAVASYFAVYKGLEEGLAKLSLSNNPLHDTPVVQRAYQILESAWVNVRTEPVPLQP